MGIRQQIRTVFGLNNTREAASPAVLGSSFAALIGRSDTITRSEAIQIPALSACVDFISGTIASLPIKLYRENSDKSSTDEVKDDKRVIMLNDESGDLLTSYEIKQAMLRDMLLDGVGYIYSDGNTLRYVSSGNVSYHINADPIFRSAYLNVGGKIYDTWNFIILTRSTKNGVSGEGIISEHATMLSAAYALLKLEKMLSITGGNKKGFLQSQKKMSEAALIELRSLWDRFYANTENNMMILNDGITFVPGGNTAVEMQLNQNKATNAAQIALLFGLSPDVISGRASNEVYASSIRTGIMPIIKKLEAAINRSMLLESEKKDMYFAVDTTELLKGDMKARYEAYRIGLDANFLQPDEVRYKEDLPPLGLDFIKLGLNDVLYDPKTKQIYTPNTNQTAQMSENILTDSGDGGIIEGRYNKNHDEKGRFTTGGASPTGANDLAVKGFRNKQACNIHWKDHGEQYIHDGITTKNQYERRAVELVESATDENILGHLDKCNHIVRYDKRTNDFAKADIVKGVITMYKPDDGISYYERIRKGDIEHGGQA